MKIEKLHSPHKELLRLQKYTEKLLKIKSLEPAFKFTLYQLHKDAMAALSFWQNSGKAYIQGKLSSNHDQLQIGGGKHYLPNFINLDLFPPADIIWDCRYGLPFADKSFSFIFSEHFFEHVDFPLSAKKILNETYRILKPKGTLFLGVPDGGKVTKAYASGDKKFLKRLQEKCYSKRNPSVEVYGDIDLVNYLFRDQVDNPNYALHFWAYDDLSLTSLLRSVGFKKVEKVKFDSRYCNPKREFYTLYLKAIK